MIYFQKKQLFSTLGLLLLIGPTQQTKSMHLTQTIIANPIATGILIGGAAIPVLKQAVRSCYLKKYLAPKHVQEAARTYHHQLSANTKWWNPLKRLHNWRIRNFGHLNVYMTPKLCDGQSAHGLALASLGIFLNFNLAENKPLTPKQRATLVHEIIHQQNPLCLPSKREEFRAEQKTTLFLDKIGDHEALNYMTNKTIRRLTSPIRLFNTEYTLGSLAGIRAIEIASGKNLLGDVKIDRHLEGCCCKACSMLSAAKQWSPTGYAKSMRWYKQLEAQRYGRTKLQPILSNYPFKSLDTKKKVL